VAAVSVDWPALRQAATAVMLRAYAPYSGFPVGAAGLADDGRTVVGCNVENASYGLSLCAECAMVAALHAGGGGRLVAVACVGVDGRQLAPCGRCRQLLWEHGGPGCLVDAPAGPRTVAELLPDAFDAGDLARAARPAARPSPDVVVPPVPDPMVLPSPDGAALPVRLAGHAGRGTVFVHPDVLAGRQVWTAYWERSSGAPGEPAGILEEAPTWPDAGAAVRWGRARTSRVVVVDASGAAAWAGGGERPAELDRDWLP